MFSVKLKEIMRKNGVTQKQLAETLGVSISSIQKYCGGSVQPNAQTLFLISELFNVSLDWLLAPDNAEHVVESNAVENSSISNKIETRTGREELASLLLNINDDEAAHLVKYYNFMFGGSKNG